MTESDKKRSEAVSRSLDAVSGIMAEVIMNRDMDFTAYIIQLTSCLVGSAVSSIVLNKADDADLSNRDWMALADVFTQAIHTGVSVGIEKAENYKKNGTSECLKRVVFQDA